jgi:arylsulfatase A-like enzyme
MDSARAIILLITAAASLAATVQAADQPNIVFIMSDDHAAHALGAYGGRLAVLDPTPRLDQLAREGMRFDRAFVTNSICTPSRATLLTGQYSHVNGVPVFNPIDPDHPVFPTALRTAGYHTALIGKWHLGTDPVGFDDWEILPGQGAYFDPLLYTASSEHKYEGHASDVITDLAIERLESRPAGKPFLLMVHHKAPHRRWEPHPRHAAEYHRRVIPEPDTLFDDYSTRADAVREQRQSIAYDLTKEDLKEPPPEGLEGAELVRWQYQRYMRDYLACVKGVDESVGRIVDWLENHGLRENTVVIYTSDQGFFLGEHGMYDKRFMYEEALRMPLVVRWPAVISPGSSCNELVINCDFAPTFLDLAGASASEQMQGRSLTPLFRGEHPRDWRTAFYYRYYHDPGDHNTRAHYGIRTTTHKLIHFWRQDQWECYDLVNDPRELNNIYGDASSAEFVAGLKAQLEQLKREVGDRDQFAEVLPAGSVGRRPRTATDGQAR